MTFIEEPVYGRPEEDIEERVDEVLDGMPILELIKYFKKYMTPNADSKPSDSFFEDFENQPFDRFLAQERFGTQDIDQRFCESGQRKETFPGCRASVLPR